MANPSAGSLPTLAGRQQLSVQEAQQHDLKTLEVAIPRIHDSIGWSYYTSTVIENFRDPECITFSATDSTQEVKGYVQLSLGSSKGYIPFIAVHQETQGQGAGYALMAAALAKTHVLGLNQLHLHHRDVPKTNAFYEKVVRTHQDHWQHSTSLEGFYPNGDQRLHVVMEYQNTTPAS